MLVNDDVTDLPAKPKPHGTWLRIAILFVLLVAAFIAFTRYQTSQRVLVGQSIGSDVFDTRLQNLEKSIVLHEKRIGDLETGHPAKSETASTPAAAPTSEPDRLDTLEKEIADLKAARPLDETHIVSSIALLSSYHRLRDRLVTGKPFAAELANFQQTMGENETMSALLESIAPFAESGVPTVQTLSTTFDEALDTLSIAESTPPPNATLWQRFLYNLRRIITIRKTAEIQGGSNDAILARAQAHLDREEIEAAVAEIKTLPDAPRAAFAAWVDEAQLVLATPATLDQLEEHVMRKAFGAPAKPVVKEQP